MSRVLENLQTTMLKTQYYILFIIITTTHNQNPCKTYLCIVLTTTCTIYVERICVNRLSTFICTTLEHKTGSPTLHHWLGVIGDRRRWFLSILWHRSSDKWKSTIIIITVPGGYAPTFIGCIERKFYVNAHRTDGKSLHNTKEGRKND